MAETNEIKGDTALPAEGRSTVADSLDKLSTINTKSLYYFIFKRLGNPHEAEDLTQQTLELALRNINEFRGNSDLTTWVFGIAFNLVRSHLSRSPSRIYEFDSDTSLDTLLSEDAGPEDNASQVDWLTRFDRCMSQLSEEMQLTIMTVLIDEESYLDASLLLNVPIGTIKSRVNRARKLLKEKMEAENLAVTGMAVESGNKIAVDPVLPLPPVSSTRLRSLIQPEPKNLENAPFLSSDEVRSAYCRLEETRNTLVAEMRKGATPDDHAARSMYFNVIESAMLFFEKNSRELLANN